MYSKQKGITLIGMLLSVAAIVFAGIVSFRVIPVYIAHYEIIHSIDALNKISSSEFSDDTSANITVLKTKLLNQFDVNSINTVPAEKIQIEAVKDNVFKISFDYLEKRPLFANISLLFDFNVEKEVQIER